MPGTCSGRKRARRSRRAAGRARPVAVDPDALEPAVDDEVVETGRVGLDEHVVVLGDPGHGRAVDERRLLFADPERDRRAAAKGESARSSAPTSQPSVSASGGGGPISRAPKRASSCRTGRSCRPAGVSSYTVDEKGGGSFFFSTMPPASSLLQPQRQDVRPDPGQVVGEVGVALRPVQQLAHDEERPALADEPERVGDRAVVAVGLQTNHPSRTTCFCKYRLRFRANKLPKG